ncbi:MAG TPA: class I SAM-dependent methyltransferase [Verrucomicrobiae bacterium]|nr:class I SAM-dependent methyltransferase [Verrucomicrobiae bacterium]
MRLLAVHQSQEDDMDEWHELKDAVRDVWTENAAFWDEYMGEDGNDFHRKLVMPTALRLLELQAGWRVLEVACGSGNFSRQMASQGVEVVGFDVSPTFIDIATQRSAASPHADRLTHQVIDATDVPAMLALGAGTFDAAVCNMALMDIPALEPLVTALSKLLKPGGRFVFTLMHPCFNSGGLTRMAELSDEGGELRTTYSVKVSHYVTAKAFLGIGIDGQPKPQHYFHRPLNGLLGAFFQHGFVMNGVEEPTFGEEMAEKAKKSISAGVMMQIPPVFAARMILTG